MSLLSEITGGEDVVDESAVDLVEQSLDVAARSVYALTAGAKEPDHGSPQFLLLNLIWVLTLFISTEAILALRASIREKLASTREVPLPIELLTPPESRDVSPIRSPLRQNSKSPGRWRVIRAISSATCSVADSIQPSSYCEPTQRLGNSNVF